MTYIQRADGVRYKLYGTKLERQPGGLAWLPSVTTWFLIYQDKKWIWVLAEAFLPDQYGEPAELPKKTIIPPDLHPGAL